MRFDPIVVMPKVLLYLSLKKSLAFAVKVPFSHPIVLPNSHLLALPSQEGQAQKQLNTRR